MYVTGEKELIMELQLKWAGNPNILVAAKAFGLKATVQVRSMKELVYLKFSMPAHTHYPKRWSAYSMHTHELIL